MIKQFFFNKRKIIAHNNKRNRRRVAFYGISKFNYEARKKLAEGQLPPKETQEKEKVVEHSSENTWTEV